ncbi:MAG TPA: S1 RNA-binding domain-containing protein [Candidatus Angelobacter sp.]|nr:S1 RNA-binding domain-containing protein [Candidatus Angelobacter sp.]
MPNPNVPEIVNPAPESPVESNESFADILSSFERSHAPKKVPSEEGSGRREATVVAVTADSVIFDIGFKTEGILLLAAFESQREKQPGKPDEPVKPGQKFMVTVKGRNPEGYYDLSLVRVERPKDWTALEKAFNEKLTVEGTVTGVVKGGLSVDVGVRAFMPASRSGVREQAEMEKLVGQEIRCRIIKLDVTEEDLVVDRRVIAEEEEKATRERRYSEVREGDILQGAVRSLADYGAFVDLGGVDALLHVGDISWGRIAKPEDVLSIGQQVEVKVLKISTDGAKRRISVGMKQLLPDPWDAVAAKYKIGERVRGAVSRLAEFGAFVELEPGIDGLIHLSEMSWSRKRVRIAGDVLKLGEVVEAVILGVNAAERRISLGLKQALGDPWAEVTKRFPVGSVVEGPVVSLTNFGAFVQLTEGIEGMVHVGDIVSEKKAAIKHPQDVLKAGQSVKAQVLEIDTAKRRVRLGMKQMLPTSLDEYMLERKEGEVVTGRIMDVSSGVAQVELGEGVHGTWKTSGQPERQQEKAEGQASGAKADLSSLSDMLKARWKGSSGGGAPKAEAVQAGQIRSFRIAKLDTANKKIELESA